MEYIFAVQNHREFEDFSRFSRQYKDVISDYIDFLVSSYQVKDLPRCIVLASAKTATEQISDIPIPAYTNDYRIVFTPELDTWKRLYLRQLDRYETDAQVNEIRAYYETSTNDHHLLQIIGHELAHHSDIFSDEAYENGGAWFEEGAVEYISCKYFLTAREFDEAVQISKKLVELYERTHPERPLSLFGNTKDFATIHYDYRRAFLRIFYAFDRCGGSIASSLQHYATAPGLLLEDK